jgi:hypothetical protein
VILCGDNPEEAVQPVTGRNWTLLFDTRVPYDGSEVRAPASPLPELADEFGGGQDLDWDVSPLLHHQHPASDLCSKQVMRREPRCGSQPCELVAVPSITTSTQPLTSALSKSCNESPVEVASPVRLMLPRAKIVLQRLAVGLLPASQVLRLFDEFLKDLNLT